MCILYLPWARYAILLCMNIILFPALEAENVLSMTDERALHIKKVLRLKEGDSFQAGIINQGKGKASAPSTQGCPSP